MGYVFAVIGLVFFFIIIFPRTAGLAGLMLAAWMMGWKLSIFIIASVVGLLVLTSRPLRFYLAWIDNYKHGHNPLRSYHLNTRIAGEIPKQKILGSEVTDYCANSEVNAALNTTISCPNHTPEILLRFQREVLKSLIDMRSEDSVLKNIAHGTFPQDGHPLIELVKYNDNRNFLGNILTDNILEDAIKKNPGLLKYFSAPYPRLPVFELYLSLHDEGNISIVIRCFVRFVYNHHSSYQQDPQWWLALLESIENRCRNQPSNSSEAALTNLCRAANANFVRKTDPEKHRLSVQINQALYYALVAKGHKDKARLLILE
ncbi:hypothetical protein MTYM_01407 [Methylococcales bacterium]|nr:hypothetical protein MTYM_01407 [Methylococcales bacterium]